MNIKINKLVDGSIVIGNTDNDYIKDAFEIVVTRTEQGVGVSFLPLLFPFNTSMSGINILTSKVMVSIDAPKDMEDQYIKATSNIIPASSVPEHLKTNLTVVK